MSAFKVPVVLSDELVSVGISMGITIFSVDGNSTDDILRAADQAMYQAKKQGGDFEFYRPGLCEKSKMQAKPSL